MQTEKVMPDQARLSSFKPRVELAHILRTHGQTFNNHYPVNPQQQRAIRDITNCRTPSLGGHMETCENDCGFLRLSFNSCRNRHCPKCQSLQKARWLLQRSEKLLPTNYFHLVVTMPHELNPLVLRNPRFLYDTFFQAASHALLKLASGWHRLQAQPGFTAILHTWNQDLRHHVHLHIVVTAGGLCLTGKRWINAKNNFLVPVKALSKIIRGKFLEALQLGFEQGKLLFSGNIEYLKDPFAFNSLIRKLSRSNWVARIKPPFSDPQHVFSYLGHYTHRVAISNQRLLAFDGHTVTFRARNNLEPGTYRIVSLPASEFIRRFLLHVLPHGFVRIRHFGLLAPRNTNTKLETARHLIQPSLRPPPIPPAESEPISWQKLLLKLTGLDITICPNCGAKLLRKPLPLHLPLSTLLSTAFAAHDTS